MKKMIAIKQYLGSWVTLLTVPIDKDAEGDPTKAVEEFADLIRLSHGLPVQLFIDNKQVIVTPSCGPIMIEVIEIPARR